MFYFYHCYFHVQYNYFSKIYQLLLIYNTFFFSIPKRFLISLITLLLISLFSFFSLKIFVISPISMLLIVLFSLLSLKRFLISLIPVSFSPFFNLKRFIISLIMLFFIFYLFQALNFSSLYIVKKLLFLNKEIYYSP